MNTRTFYLAAFAATLAACTSMPKQSSAFDKAQIRVHAAQSDPQVRQLAPDELNRASIALQAADQARSDGADKAAVDHLSYIAAQRAALAQDAASSRASQAIVAGAAAERDKQRLAQRTSEVDAARQSSAQKTADLAVADAAVSRGQEQVSDLQQQLKDLNAKQTARGLVVTLGGVLFYTGQSTLLPDGLRDVTKLADFMKRHPRHRASIEGYTDNVGSVSANLDLSGRRAQAVVSELVGQGVSADRLSVQAHGEADPVADNSTAAGRQMNRRVEVVFTPAADDVSTQ